MIFSILKRKARPITMKSYESCDEIAPFIERFKIATLGRSC